MKACRVCGRLFSDEAAFCQADGQELSRVSQTPGPGDPNDPRVGQLLCDRYLVYRVVADGAMGRVYEALDQKQERHVALKILHEDVARDEVSVERFKREYEVSRQLPHQHIVEVTDFQPTDDSYVLVMEFLIGEELRAVLQRDAVLPPERVIRMVSQIAIGLDQAHARHFIHRDLKPDNIFLCQTQQGDIAKVLDFGSVKDRKRTGKQLTVIGTTIGSPYYMSPEQAQGLDTLDHRADVWALSAMVYECLTGSMPFSGSNGPSILVQILRNEPVLPSEAAAGRPFPVPTTVDRVLSRGLRKGPSTRIASVGELADELGRAYGLAGDHAQWAVVPEAQLARQIHERLPQLQAEMRAQRPSNPTDAFFGEEGALGDDSAPSQPLPLSKRTSASPASNIDKREPTSNSAAHLGADASSGERSAVANGDRSRKSAALTDASERATDVALEIPVSGTPLWVYAGLALLVVVAALWFVIFR